MDRASISDSASHAAVHAFTLIEVVVAVGLLAVTGVAMLALQDSMSRSVAEVAEHDRAAQLADAIDAELCRLRDLPIPAGQPTKLDALAQVIPPSDSDNPLRLVASREGTRVIRESDADDPIRGVALRDRYYLIEVRQQPAPLGYVSGAGYFAVTLTMRWPYQIATGPNPGDAAAADLSQASVLLLNSALTP